MKKNLSFKEIIAVASMLFGMFFGAGNLIFPVHMGQIAGSNVWSAALGFVITGVGIPLLAIIAFGKSDSSGLLDMSSKVGKGYGIFFTCLLYLTIGPFFAIPRCATTSFTVGLEPILGSETGWPLFIFTLIFFLLVLYFSLRPSGILTWIGKIINPAFLVVFGVLIIVALINPMTSVANVTPEEAYEGGKAITSGLLEGYNTLDVLAGLAFGIVVIDVIKNLGVKDPDKVSADTAKSGIFCCLIMAVIYFAASVIGAQSRGVYETSANGGIALAQISSHYFGSAGQIILAVIVTLACLKTAIGLVTSIGEAFSKMFSNGKGYKWYAIGFTVFAFGVSNFGLNSIIKFSLPALLFLYPLAIVLILMMFIGKPFDYDKKLLIPVIALTFVAALFDFFNALGVSSIAAIGQKILPLFGLGFGWVVPAAIGLAIGFILHFACKKKAA